METNQGHLLGALNISGLELRAGWWDLHTCWAWLILSGVCRGLKPQKNRGSVSLRAPHTAQLHLSGSGGSPLNDIS